MKYLKKFNESIDHNKVDTFIRKADSIINYDESEYEQGEEPMNVDILSLLGELYNDMGMTVDDLREVDNSNKINDPDQFIKIILDEVESENTVNTQDNTPLEKVEVYCRVYDAGDGYVGDRWFMTEEEAWEVEEGEPNVMKVETYIGSNAHNAALKNEGIR